MKVALVHDYLNEFGGAERVLLALSEIYPKAPIYTSFYRKGSSAWKRFKHKDIRASWFHYLPFAFKLASPLRFLSPLIWSQFDLSKYDVIISSSNWYITKGFKRKKRSGIEICYCHTPPRYLYGFPTSINWQKYWPVRIYGMVLGHFLRMYDFKAAQRVNFFVANSENVKRRIEKFYRREAKVIYPPVGISSQNSVASSPQREDYYLVVSRIVGGKGLELAVGAANKLGIKLKIVGKAAGWGSTESRLQDMAGKNIEFAGEVSDEDLWDYYSTAKALIATAKDEDFGITPVEAMAAGTPVIAYRGGGYLESVVDGKTGVLFDDYSVDGLVKAVREFEGKNFSSEDCVEQAEKFSEDRFKKEIREFVRKCVGVVGD